MDRKFIQMVSLTAFALIGLAGGNGLNAKVSLPTTPPPTKAEIITAYNECLNHDCTGFQQWSIKAYEICSRGDNKNDDNDGNACEVARDLLAEIKKPRVAQPVYDKEVLRPFKRDNEHNLEGDPAPFSPGFLDD